MIIDPQRVANANEILTEYIHLWKFGFRETAYIKTHDLNELRERMLNQRGLILCQRDIKQTQIKLNELQNQLKILQDEKQRLDNEYP